MNKPKMKKLNNVEVKICKMSESSGNEQFFVRLARTDETTHGSILDYDCFQTKHLDKNECLERAWFSSGMLARFCGLSSMDEIIFVGVSDDEAMVMKEALYLKW
jgi:hypothetical protein